MTTLKKNLIRSGLLFLLFAAYAAASAQNSFVTVTGTLKDAKTNEKINYAAITVPNTGI